ncbi:MAG: PilZ domain-containing protein [Allosphingosinicella sp.]
MDSKPSFYKKRQAARTRVYARSRLSEAHLYAIEVKVCDVSTGGFMAECPDPVRIGSYVSLDVPGLGPVEAQVRWQLGGRMGGMFLDPISLSECEWTATPAEAA